jgi:integrase
LSAQSTEAPWKGRRLSDIRRADIHEFGWPYGLLVQLLILTGARRGEIGTARWSEIDLPGRVWTIPAERSKNGIAHSVPLSPRTLAILESLPRIHGGQDFVFTTNGETPVAGFGRAKAQLDAALPDVPHWTFHDLRRTCASGMARLGIAPHVVEAVLNHRNGTIRGVAAVYNRYNFADEKRRALELWGAHIERLASGAVDNVILLAGHMN